MQTTKLTKLNFLFCQAPLLDLGTHFDYYKGVLPCSSSWLMILNKVVHVACRSLVYNTLRAADLSETCGHEGHECTMLLLLKQMEIKHKVNTDVKQVYSWLVVLGLREQNTPSFKNKQTNKKPIVIICSHIAVIYLRYYQSMLQIQRKLTDEVQRTLVLNKPQICRWSQWGQVGSCYRLHRVQVVQVGLV